MELVNGEPQNALLPRLKHLPSVREVERLEEPLGLAVPNHQVPKVAH